MLHHKCFSRKQVDTGGLTVQGTLVAGGELRVAGNGEVVGSLAVSNGLVVSTLGATVGTTSTSAVALGIVAPASYRGAAIQVDVATTSSAGFYFLKVPPALL